MKGLLLKDLANLTKQTKIIVILVVLCLAAALAPGTQSMTFLAILAMISLMIMITLFYTDERDNWEKYALTLSISRQDLVLSKYVFGLGLSIITFVLTLLFPILNGNYSTQEALYFAIALTSASMFLLGIVMPLFYRFGVQKGRMIMLIPILLIVFLGRQAPDPEINYAWLKAVPFAAVLTYLLSYFISLGIMKRKEFQ